MAGLLGIVASIGRLARRTAVALLPPREGSAAEALRAFRAALAVLVAVAATVTSLTLPAHAAPATPRAPSTGKPAGRQQPVTLEKTGTDLATGSSSTTTQGDTVQWVVSATNPDGAPANTVITDVIQGGPGSTPQTQSYVPNSLKVPPGFSRQWSTNAGTSFTSTDQGAATNAIRATNPVFASPATGQVVQIPPPFTPINTATGGDGFTPILYTATINGMPTPEVWNIYHHGASSQAAVVCTDLLTNGPCPLPDGTPASWPQPLNSAAVGGTSGDLGSTRTPTYVQSGSKLYYAAVSRVTFAEIGVGCIDLQAQKSCGFVPLQTGSGSVVGGVVEAPNGLIYAVSGTGEILCYDPTANASCGTFSIGLPPNEGQGGFTGDYSGTMTVINGKIYVSDNEPVPNPTVMSCFDPTTNAACTGWTTPKVLVTPTAGGAARADNVFATYDSAGTAIGVCSVVGGVLAETNPPVGTVVCFDFVGNPIAAAPGLQTLVSTNVASGESNFQIPLTITAPNGHLDTEFPYWIYLGNTPTLNSTEYCYDWTTQSPCGSFGNAGVVNGPPNVDGGYTSPYGFAYDGQCKYSLGDVGFLFSMDPTTGASPCLKTKAQGSLDPSAYYCDGKTGHVTSYGTVSLVDIDPTTVNFAQSSVTVKDSNGAALGTFPFDTTTMKADISSVPISASPIQVVANLTLISGASFTPDNQPKMQVTFVGDPPQVCYQTKVSEDCTVTSVSDQATATTNGMAPVTSNTVTLQVTPGPSCKPELTVLKEVCTSVNPGDCGPGGSGPWASLTTVAPGGTAYWRITVTNPGTVPVTGITLTDAVTPACATAAGTFNLAAGANRQVFCNLPDVTAPTTNVVTATFPGPGGTPITTPPSEATANVPSLAIVKEVCTSATAGDCGPGGNGPWAGITTLPPGGTAYWRITVTNTDGVDINGITLTDAVTPACATAAGTFNLAAGANRQVFCNLPNVTKPTTNVVTATFPGPGGTPITTPPSEATANVPSLAIVKEVCTSATVANCIEGGNGPWAGVTTVPPGATAYWRITVTNTDGVDISGITLTDAVTPACATVAGMFNLPAGASTQVFCNLPGITTSTTNVVTASFPGPGGTPITTPPAEATVDVPSLAIVKEVCTSATAGDCGPGGNGPWASVTTVAPGGTAYWRITVTNTGAVKISGITLNDAVTPACATAAGTFDLAAGANKQIFCNLPNVTKPTTNVVTATFPGPGGTPPITTPPSEATANVPSLAIVKEVCTSAVAADCGPGGSGPWAGVTTVPSGGTAYWRITVTNDGPSDITGITLTDPVTPACATAAGTFNLAAGANKQIFCNLPNVTQATANVVTATFPGPGGTPITTPPAEATVDAPSLTILKEVCTSTTAADCASGGSGPWAKTTIIPSGATAYWRITVTNTGTVPIAGITLTDAVTPACVTAAGTFNLATGANKQVFCDLANVTTSTTNVVTATFPGPGGHPITTPPSEATADVPSLAIVKEVCTSATAADCGSGGSGPWASITTVAPGGTAYWRITVTNTGAVPVNGITLADPVTAGCVTAAGTFNLAPGADKQIFCNLPNVTTSTTNVVTATFPGPGGTPITTPPSEAAVDVPSLTIVKEVCASTTAANCGPGGNGPWAGITTLPPGGTAYWRITVTNTDGVDINGITLTDTVTPACATAAGTFNLTPGADKQIYCNLPNVTQSTTNVVTATFPGPGGTPPITTPPSEATANVPSLTINKEVCTSTTAADCGSGGNGPWASITTVAPGGTAYWRITVTNTDGVDINGITLTDTVTPGCVTAAGTFNLTAGTSKQIFCNLPNVTTSTTNVVTATFPGPGGTPPITTPPSEATANVPSLAIVKEVCTSATAADCGSGGSGPWAGVTTLPPGGTAYWRITVTNTDGVDINDITLNDAVTPACATAAGTFNLAPGANKQIFCNLPNVTQSTTNVVTATFPGPGGTPITTPPSEATANVPSLAIVKEVCTSTTAADCGPGGNGPWAGITTVAPGGTAYWRITVTNTDGVDINGITLTDTVTPACATAAGTFNLTPGANKQIFCNLPNVTTSTTNVVTATFPGPGGTPITTPPSEATANVPSLAIVKEVCTSATAADCGPGGNGPWAGITTVTPGGTAYWRITVTNTDGVDINDITLNDAVTPACATAAGTFNLAPGANKQIFCNLPNVTQSTTNVVTATFPGPGGTPITTPPSEATANVPSLAIVKEVCTSTTAADCGPGGNGPWAGITTVAPGGTAYWRITVTNTDGVDINGITLTDTVTPGCVTAAGTFNLTPGANKQIFCNLPNVTTSTTNVVTATFPGPGGTPITTPPSEATANVPSLAIVKEVCTSATAADCGPGGNGPWAGITTVTPGGTAYWRITVTNTDGVDINGITLTDAVTPACATAAGTFNLAAGANKQIFCSSSHLTESTTNTVAATFPGPGGTPITTPPSEATANVPSLTINKEVCQSDVPGNCAEGGSGPWGKETTLHKNDGKEDCDRDKCKAYWRITVTNTGTVDISGITLNDQQEASCVVAAGTFSLASGQAKMFFCSSVITEDTTNTVTASFLPPNAAPGTPPITTPPSSAIARCAPPCDRDKCNEHKPEPGDGHGHGGHGDGMEVGHGPEPAGYPQPGGGNVSGPNGGVLPHTGAAVVPFTLTSALLAGLGALLVVVVRVRRNRKGVRSE
ncbi:hypothetical protein [Streptomyces sp. MJM8645]|uniref:DUF7617 domain-containing protein n=2 Tax=Streptomycetaceae TaxID=2062 RepID=UPI0007AF2EA6|nr:hypothetical protein [Streptomyces sp. MJM8645]